MERLPAIIFLSSLPVPLPNSLPLPFLGYGHACVYAHALNFKAINYFSLETRPLLKV